MDKCYITYNGYSSDQKKKNLSILHTTIPENIMYLKINKSSTHTVLEFSEALLFMSGKKKQNLKNNFFFFLALKSLPISHRLALNSLISCLSLPSQRIISRVHDTWGNICVIFKKPKYIFP